MTGSLRLEQVKSELRKLQNSGIHDKISAVEMRLLSETDADTLQYLRNMYVHLTRD